LGSADDLRNGRRTGMLDAEEESGLLKTVAALSAGVYQMASD
jgi:hypothetical protein